MSSSTRHTRVVVTHYGGPDALRVVEEERPEPTDGEVRVRVLAAGVSLPAREGVHPETPPVPFTPGWDLVGVVDQDFANEIHRLTGEGADAVFDPFGGPHLWHSRKALRPGGTVVGYGLRSSIRGEGLASGRPGRRQRFRGTAIFGLYIAGGWLLPGRTRIVPHSIQTLKRLKPEFFRMDLIALFELLRQRKIKPIIAQRFPLAEARQAQELLARGSVTGKIVLVLGGSSIASGNA